MEQCQTNVEGQAESPLGGAEIAPPRIGGDTAMPDEKSPVLGGFPRKRAKPSLRINVAKRIKVEHDPPEPRPPTPYPSPPVEHWEATTPAVLQAMSHPSSSSSTTFMSQVSRLGAAVIDLACATMDHIVDPKRSPLPPTGEIQAKSGRILGDLFALSDLHFAALQAVGGSRDTARRVFTPQVSSVAAAVSALVCGIMMYIAAPGMSASARISQTGAQSAQILRSLFALTNIHSAELESAAVPHDTATTNESH